MTNVKEAISQSELYLKLYGDRLSALKTLAEVDSRLAQVSKGMIPVVAQAVTPEAPKKRGPGRPKGSKNRKNGKPQVAPVQAPAPAPAAQPQAEQPEEGRKRFANKTSLKKLILKVCGRHPSGIKLDELVKKCYEAGYRSTSGEKGFVQNIRTNLHTLMNKGAVVRDEDKKYHKKEEAQPEPQPADEAQVAAT